MSPFFNGLYFRGLLPDWPSQLPSVTWSPSSVYHLYGIYHLRGRNPVSLVSVVRITRPALRFGFSPLLSLILRLLLDFPVFSSFSCLTAASTYHRRLRVNRNQLLSENVLVGPMFTFSVTEEASASVELCESKIIVTSCPSETMPFRYKSVNPGLAFPARRGICEVRKPRLSLTCDATLSSRVASGKRLCLGICDRSGSYPDQNKRER